MKKISRRNAIKRLAQLTAVTGVGAPGLSKVFANPRELGFSPYILTIHCDGGWDPTMVFDNKISSSLVTTEPGSTVSLGAGNLPYIANANRPSVSSFFNQYGSNATIINGITSNSLSHDQAKLYASASFSPETNRYTDWLSFYATQLGSSLPLPHVVIDAPYLPGPYSNFTSYLTDAMIAEYQTEPLTGSSTLAETSLTSLTSYLQKAYVATLDNNIGTYLDSEKIQAITYSVIKEDYLKTALRSITLDNAKSTFSNHGKIAINLFAKGYSQSVSLQAGKPREWDTHRNHFTKQSTSFEMLFSGLLDILSEADTLGILDKLTIVVKSEMGRAPKINSSEQNGKDHWAYTSSLLWGAGIAKAKVIGATDDSLIGYKINPIFGSYTDPDTTNLNLNHIYAGLFSITGIPYSILMPDIQPASIAVSTEAS